MVLAKQAEQNLSFITLAPVFLRSDRKRPFGATDDEIKVLTVKNGEGQELKEARAQCYKTF